MASAKPKSRRRFNTTERANVPIGRNGKHKSIVTAILSDLEELDRGQSLKIPLSELPDTKVNVRSALNRATRKLDRSVATACDEEFLYVWND
ncbi:MAG TPA: hypothetical protein VFA76_02805 [Terriglobales bacterium]|nr:hypothetical protein [Terriglobales bacterium]